MLDSAEGVQHLHKHNLVHRDLAARNLLITSLDQVKTAKFIQSFFLFRRRRRESCRFWTFKRCGGRRKQYQNSFWSYSVRICAALNLNHATDGWPLNACEKNSIQ